MDNTGKTTLQTQLAKDFPQLHTVPSIGNKHDLDQIRAQALTFNDMDRDDPLTLWDRSRLISEYIYNPILRKRPLAFNYDEWMWAISSMARRPQLIVYCHRPLLQLKRTFAERDQLEGVYEHLADLQVCYDRMMTMFQLLYQVQGKRTPVMWYDYNVNSYISVQQRVQAYIKEVE